MWLGESMWLLEYERNMGKGRYRKMLVFAKTQEELDEHLDRILADKAVCKAFGVVPVSV